MFLVYCFNGMVFGSYIPMRSDFLTGYIPIIKNTARTILEGENIFFSFSSCLGLNNIFYLANIIFSPFNILFLILFNVDENIVTVLVVMLKAGCIAVSFNYFSIKVLKNNKFSSVIISAFYSLCSYSIAYCTITIMWLDAMMILPLLCIAIVECVVRNKRAFLIVLYAYLFISQFYIAYMVGIFSFAIVLLYIFLIYDSNNEKSIKDKINKLSNWFLCVIIAILLSAFVWVPTLFFILGNRAQDSSEVIEISASLLQILNSFFWGMGYNISGTFGYLYCGIPSLIGTVLFFCCNKIVKKEKIFAFAILGIFVLCMISTPLNLFLHVFDQPDFFFYRYSFVISFSACAICSRFLAIEDKFEAKPIFIVSSVLCAFYLILEQTTPLWNLESSLHPSLNDNFGFIINFLLINTWIFVFWLSFNVKNKRIVLMAITVLIMGAEIISGSTRLIDSPTSKDTYYSWYKFADKTVKEIKNKDTDLYRMVFTNNICMNSDSWFSYNGVNDFGDQEKMKVRDFLSDIGFATSPRYISDTGYNEVSNMLLAIRYNLIRPYNGVDFDENNEIGEGIYLKNENILNIGYLVDGNAIFYERESRNVFENLNDIAKNMTNLDKDCFVQVPDSNIIYDNLGIEFGSDGVSKVLRKTDDGGSLYITVLNDGYDQAYFQLENDKSVYDLKDYTVVGARNNGEFLNIPVSLSTSNRMYYNKDKDRFHIVINSADANSYNEIEYNDINLYYLDKKALKEQYNNLASGQLQVSEWKNGYIRGNVHVEGYRRLLFLSIPYDPGWTAYINGTETDITTVFDGTFLGVLLPAEGDYEVEFKYTVPGLKIGIMTSLLGIIAFLAVVFEKQIKEFENRK